MMEVSCVNQPPLIPHPRPTAPPLLLQLSHKAHCTIVGFLFVTDFSSSIWQRDFSVNIWDEDGNSNIWILWQHWVFSWTMHEGQWQYFGSSTVHPVLLHVCLQSHCQWHSPHHHLPVSCPTKLRTDLIIYWFDYMYSHKLLFTLTFNISLGSNSYSCGQKFSLTSSSPFLHVSMIYNNPKFHKL